jgi:hypothetical protein
MTLGSTQPVIEMSSRNLPGGKERLARKAADNLTAICEPTVSQTPWASTVCYRDRVIFLYIYIYIYILLGIRDGHMKRRKKRTLRIRIST